jgi:hypothetical protein
MLYSALTDSRSRCVTDIERGEIPMSDELAAANVNRSYQLAASSIAIFTFLLFFLYPKFESGTVHAIPYQATLIVMGVATFSFAFSSFFYYGSSLGSRIEESERVLFARRGDRFWLLGCVLLFLTPCLILFTIRLLPVAFAWFTLWLVYLFFVLRFFPRVQTAKTR